MATCRGTRGPVVRTLPQLPRLFQIDCTPHVDRLAFSQHSTMLEQESDCATIDISVASPLSDPLASCLDALGQLPTQVRAELDAAWESLTAYENELADWFRELNDYRVQMEQAIKAADADIPESARDTVPASVPTPPTAPSPYVPEAPQVTRTVSAAARQFAALRRQRNSQRGPQ